MSMAAIPDIDALYPLQAVEGDRAKRAAILEKMQQLVHDKAIYAPIWQLLSSTASARGSRSRGWAASPALPTRRRTEELTLKAT